LIEAARIAAPELGALARFSSIPFVLGTLVVLGAETLTLVGLLQTGRLAVGKAVERALQHFPALLLITATAWFVSAGAVLATVFLGSACLRLFPGGSDRTHDLVFLAFVGVGLAGASLFAVIGGLARAVRVRQGTSVRRAIRAGFEIFARRRRSAVVAWLAPASGAALAVALGAYVTSRLPLDRPLFWPLAGTFAVHQLAAFSLVWLRQVWLAASLRLSVAQELEPDASR
jgi:hypothetical protein